MNDLMSGGRDVYKHQLGNILTSPGRHSGPDSGQSRQYLSGSTLLSLSGVTHSPLSPSPVPWARRGPGVDRGVSHKNHLISPLPTLCATEKETASLCGLLRGGNDCVVSRFVSQIRGQH